jgi:hypothetical protein
MGPPASHYFLTLKLLNLPNSFEDSRVQFPSSYWLVNFSNLHRRIWKSGKPPLAAFQKSFVKIREMYQPVGRKRLKFTTE